MKSATVVEAPREQNSTAAPRPAPYRAGLLTALAVALFFAVWGLRGLGFRNVIDTDAARHAMNGVFLLDFLASGNWTHPLQFAESYYAHFPALSLPYHPPVFPLMEALFFGIFGVSIVTARVVIALCTFLALLLLMRIGSRATRSVAVAICAAAAFASWRSSLMVASDATLEFPALLFTLAAILVVANLDRFDWRRAVLFGALAGVAVWTKQHAVFLVALPLVFLVLARRFAMLRTAVPWIALISAGLPVVALHWFSSVYRGAGTDQVVRSYAITDTIL
ncbi:MAG: glycosyltransferase family 39 protein, partial [Acidobacteriaceae bacterium]|nr:glycosyltransferase family 39 protein [Acidobacteriaceae bacterium]